MIVAFCEWLENNPRALEQVSAYSRANNLLLAVKENLKKKLGECIVEKIIPTSLDVFSKPRRVIVSRRLGITEGLKNGIGSQYLTLDLAGIIKREFRLGLGY